ncbi:alanine racemase [Candidatus Kuenenbacteria bacterium]|nr:alanine racemase [Candidatus Kuenenbacteria bacterium]
MQDKTWVEISRENLIHNIEQFRQRVGGEVKLAGVVKSNAYGHGLVDTVSVIEQYVDWIAVDSVDEALECNSLREGDTSTCRLHVLVLGYTLFDRLEEVVENGFHQVVANVETLEELIPICEKLNKPAHIHLKIETGTARQGIWQDDLPRFLDKFDNCELLNIAGVSTHFANIEDTTDHSYAKQQLEKFKQAVQFIEQWGSGKYEGLIKHTACSAATVLFPETYFDLVRIGISMYGMWSSTETQVSAMQKGIQIDLKPALTWKTKVGHLKVLPAGSGVSYGCTEKVTTATKIAVLPIGYWDGYDRKLSSVGNVLIRGKRCRVIGRVCMNMIVVDVNHVPDIQLEDEAVLLGKQGDEEITAEEIARKVGTINYEVVTRINPQIRRVAV